MTVDRSFDLRHWIRLSEGGELACWDCGDPVAYFSEELNSDEGLSLAKMIAAAEKHAELHL